MKGKRDGMKGRQDVRPKQQAEIKWALLWRSRRCAGSGTTITR